MGQYEDLERGSLNERPTEAINGNSLKRSMEHVVQRILIWPHLNARMHCLHIGVTVTSTS